MKTLREAAQAVVNTWEQAPSLTGDHLLSIVEAIMTMRQALEADHGDMIAAFEARYRCDAADPQSEASLSIWRDAWYARGGVKQAGPRDGLELTDEEIVDVWRGLDYPKGIFNTRTEYQRAENIQFARAVIAADRAKRGAA